MHAQTLTHLLLAATTAAAIAAPAGAATWESPVTLTGAVASIDGLQIAQGSDRRTLVSWGYRLGTGVSGVEAASHRPDGRWGPTRALGTRAPVPGNPGQATGVGSALFGVAAYGANGWLGLGAAKDDPDQSLAWWKGNTVGAAHFGGVLPEQPWEAGRIATFPDGRAVIAYTTMRPRRGSGSNLRPRVVVVMRGSVAGFGATHRISPLPPAPPYGHNLGPQLSATAVTATAGGRSTVVVAWQRTGRIEARVSRDRGRTYGRVRYLGPSQDAFPRIVARISAAGKVVVVWGTRERQGAQRTLVSRAAVAAPGARFTTRVLEHSAPLDVLAPPAYDQFGPTTLAGFDGETPFAVWQTVVDGRIALRTGHLEGDTMTTTFTAPTGQDVVLDDLTTSRSATAAIAWHGLGRFGTFGPGFVAQAPAGGRFGDVQQLPGPVGVTGIRLAYDPRGLLATWTLRTGPTSTVLAAELR